MEDAAEDWHTAAEESFRENGEGGHGRRQTRSQSSEGDVLSFRTRGDGGGHFWQESELNHARQRSIRDTNLSSSIGDRSRIRLPQQPTIPDDTNPRPSPEEPVQSSTSGVDHSPPVSENPKVTSDRPSPPKDDRAHRSTPISPPPVAQIRQRAATTTSSPTSSQIRNSITVGTLPIPPIPPEARLQNPNPGRPRADTAPSKSRQIDLQPDRGFESRSRRNFGDPRAQGPRRPALRTRSSSIVMPWGPVPVDSFSSRDYRKLRGQDETVSDTEKAQVEPGGIGQVMPGKRKTGPPSILPPLNETDSQVPDSPRRPAGGYDKATVQGGRDRESEKVDTTRTSHIRTKPGRKERMKGLSSSLGRYLKTPSGMVMAAYGLLVVFWGSALMLFLLGWIKTGGQAIWVEICSQILCGLFTITGIGLIPWRVVNTYRSLKIMRLQRYLAQNSTHSLDVDGESPSEDTVHARERLQGHNTNTTHEDDNQNQTRFQKGSDLEANSDSAGLDTIPTWKRWLIDLRPKGGIPRNPDSGTKDPVREAAADLEQYSEAFARSQSWYHYKKTEDSTPFPIGWAIWALILQDGNSLFQCGLSGIMWGLNRFNRPSWLTGVLITLSFLCGIASAVLVWRVGERCNKYVGGDQRRLMDATEEKFDPREASSHGWQEVGAEGHERETRANEVV